MKTMKNKEAVIPDSLPVKKNKDKGKGKGKVKIKK
jgi:hypothetical protein